MAVGLGLFLYKVLALNYPLTSDVRTDAWIVEAHASFAAKNKPTKLSLFVPKSTQEFLIMDESFISRGFGLTTQFKDGNRLALWSIRNASGQQGLYYRALVKRGSVGDVRDKSKPPEILPSGYEGALLEATKSLIAEIRAKSADAEGFVVTLLKQMNSATPDSNLQLLLGRRPPSLKVAEVATKILAEAGIFARIVFGIILQDQTKNTPIIHRLEVYDSGTWKSIDVLSGDTNVPEEFLPWWRGSEPFVTLSGADKLRTVVSVAKHEERGIYSAISGVQVSNPPIVKFSLFSLPLETQSVYRVILMIPIGAFLVVVLRNIIGIRTFGTFMPVLIALAFRETELIWGVMFFTLLVSIGLTARFYLEHLKLVLVPRLASVLIIVIILMAMLSIFTHMLGVERGLSVALFPMVILTMTIERMSIMWDELGSYEAFKHGIGSLLVAALIYGIISSQTVGHLIFVFPELLLVVLSLTLMIGRYTGYRLLELKRFKALAEY